MSVRFFNVYEEYTNMMRIKRITVNIYSRKMGYFILVRKKHI